MQHNEEQEQKDRVQEELRQKLSLLPEQPGCYIYKNREGTVIYVGKAKVLRNRVRSYFTGSHNGKTQRLVQDIADLEYIVTKSNMEALILECNLIKQYHPRYNVLLKDDKSFPYIKLTHEAHPRLEVTRRVVKDKGKYFGPYPHAFAAQQTKKLLDRLYPLRKCGTLPDKVCLYYHIGQCVAPCEHEVAAGTYETMTQEIVRFLGGGQDEIKKALTRQMHEAAEALEFEKAKELRDQIASIDAVMEKQTITTSDDMDRDVFGYAVDKGLMCVQILYMRQGKMIERRASVFPYYAEEYDDFLSYVAQYYSENPALPREILLPPPKEEEDVSEALEAWLKVKVAFPARGRKKDMVRMAQDNARLALEEKFRLEERNEERTVKAAENLGSWIGAGMIHRIEAFDNSNLQGVNPVSAMIVFVDGKPARKEYRKYKIRTVEGPDDYASMREVIRRRYERVLKEGLPLPDLILVDGGKGQMSAASDVLENELGLYIPVGGLAKDNRHKTAQLLMGEPPEPVPIPRGSQEFYLLHRIQDEVHRFAVTFHREVRAKSMVASRLDDIPGVGEKRRKGLLQHFGSIRKIREAQPEDFKPLGIGDKLARTIIEALQDGEEPGPGAV